jgi:hypothetical protein
MSWWNLFRSKIVRALGCRTHATGTGSRIVEPYSTSVKYPLPTQEKQKNVPPPLRAAMASVKSGDFIFDPASGR